MPSPASSTPSRTAPFRLMTDQRPGGDRSLALSGHEQHRRLCCIKADDCHARGARVSLFLKKTAWFSRSLPASRRKAAKVVLGCDSVRASAQVTMSEALNTEVAIKDAPGSGKNQEAA